MEFNWLVENYLEIVNQCLGYRKERRPRGAIKSLADKLRCHSTFIAQVLSGRAHFSPEQAYEFCSHFSFSAEQQDFFLILLMRDRAGTAALKEYYEQKLQDLLEANRDLKPKIQGEESQVGIFESEYFGSWIYQTVHALTQIKRFQSSATISNELGLSIDEVTAILIRLEIMSLVTRENSFWKSSVNSMHLPKDSHFIRSLHTTWKTKILSDLQVSSTVEGTRFNGVITVSEKDYQRVRSVLVKTMGDIRKIVEASSSEHACVLSFDCYKM